MAERIRLDSLKYCLLEDVFSSSELLNLTGYRVQIFQETSQLSGTHFFSEALPIILVTTIEECLIRIAKIKFSEENYILNSL